MLYLFYILHVILMHILYIRSNIDAYITCAHTHAHIVCLVLFLPATTVVAALFREFQPESNNAAGSVVVPKTTVLSLTTLFEHKYATSLAASSFMACDKIFRLGNSSDSKLDCMHELPFNIGLT